MSPMQHGQPLANLPASIRARIGGATWTESHGGYSQTATYRIEPPAREPLFLKLGPVPEHGPALKTEAAVLNWLDDKVPVPRVVAFAARDGSEFLLMTAVPGYPAYDPACPLERSAALAALAAGLQRLHALDTTGCPFDWRLERRFELAAQRTAAGLVDEENFEPQYRGRRPVDLLARAREFRPATEDVVFTHGDYCLPNVLLDKEGVSGFIDLAGAGLADRYHDLALAYRSIHHNFGDGAWGELFLKAYGLDAPDRRKIEFYILLDEFA